MLPRQPAGSTYKYRKEQERQWRAFLEVGGEGNRLEVCNRSTPLRQTASGLLLWRVDGDCAEYCSSDAYRMLGGIVVRQVFLLWSMCESYLTLRNSG